MSMVVSPNVAKARKATVAVADIFTKNFAKVLENLDDMANIKNNSS